MKKNRMTYLDMAKGIGILFMIVGHTISLLPTFFSREPWNFLT